MPRLFEVILAVLLVFIGNTLAYSYVQENIGVPQESRERYSVIGLNNKIYLIGGLATQTLPPPKQAKGKKVVKQPIPKAVRSIDYYEPKTNKFVEVSSLPIALYDLATVVLDNKIYLIGGYNSRAIAVNTVYSFNPENNKITKIATLPMARAGLRAVVLDGSIYVFGGKTKLPNAEVLVYTPKTNKWKKLSSMSTAREQVALSVVNDKVLVAGGKGLKNLSLTTFEEYNPITNEWKQLLPLPTARVNATALTFDNRFYIIGGYKFESEKQIPITTIDCYDPATKTWTNIASLAIPQNIVGASILEKELNMFTSESKIFALNINKLALPENNKSDASDIAVTTAIPSPIAKSITPPVAQPVVQAVPTPSTTPIAPVVPPQPTNPNPVPSSQPVKSSPTPQPSTSPSRTNRAPIIYKIAKLSARVGEEICFTPEVSDPENDQITLSCSVPNSIRYIIQGSSICLTPLSGYRGTLAGTITARDSYGNQSKATFYLEILENHRPTFSYVHELASSLVLYAGQTREIDIVATDIDSNSDPNRDGRIALSIVKAPDFVDLRDYGYGRGKLIFRPPTNWNSSNNEVIIEVRDFGNPSLTSELRFYININQPNRPPVIDPIPDIVLRAGESLRLPINIYDPDGDYLRVEFNISDYSFGNVLQYITGYLLVNPPYNREGRFTATLTVIDSAGNRQQETFYVTVVVNHMPTIETIYNVEVEENAQQQVRIIANDIDRSRDPRADGYLKLRLLEQPSFVDFRDDGYGQATLTIRPRIGDSGTEKRKKYNITVEAIDNGNPSLRQTSSFAIIVTAPNSPPIIRGLPDQLIRIRGGEQYCIDFSATDPDNDRLTIDVISDYQQYVHASDNRICVQPGLDFDGKITVNVIAKDSQGKVAQKSFAVRSFINHKPSFEQSINNTTIEEGKTLSINIKVSDKDSERDSNQDGRVELTLAQAPPFVTFSNSGQGTATLLINPQEGSAGNVYPVEIIATDNGNPRLSSSLRFQLTVIAAKILDPPTISSVRFESQKLIILGSYFVEQCIVEVNGQQMSAGFFKQKENRLVLTGKRKALNLVVGQNSIVVISGNRRSNAFSYYFEKPQTGNAEDDN